MKKYLSRILNYFLWTLVAFLLSFVHIRFFLGIDDLDPFEGFLKILNIFFKYAFFWLWLIIGGIIALLYILVDVFYLHKRLESIARPTMIRLLLIIGIAVVVGIVHYVLEKVVDVI